MKKQGGPVLGRQLDPTLSLYQRLLPFLLPGEGSQMECGLCGSEVECGSPLGSPGSLQQAPAFRLRGTPLFSTALALEGPSLDEAMLTPMKI